MFFCFRVAKLQKARPENSIMKYSSSIVFPLFPLVITLLLFSSLASSDSSTYDKFLQCLQHQTYPSDDIRPLLHSRSSNNSSSYTSVLRSYIGNLRFSKPTTPKPELIITPKKKSHVSGTVICSKNMGLQLRIRSGGHDFEGLSYASSASSSPFIILDMFNLRAIDVNVDKRTAYVEAGATIGELYFTIWDKSKNVLGFPAGVCPTVGIGGHISGGGYGNMLRKFGLSVDHVIDAEIVDANGKILNKNSMGNDLFWAIRGGGGASYGVVLSYTLNLVPVPETVTVFQVMRSLEEDNLTNLVYKWQSVMKNIDHDLFIRVILQPVTISGKIEKSAQATFMALFLGGVDRLFSLMNTEFPELGVQKSDCLEMGWIESVLFWANMDSGSTPDVLRNRTYDARFLKRKSDYVQEPIHKDGLELLWKKLIELGKPGLLFNPYGGKMSEISESETPFPHRIGNLYKIQYSISWDEEGEAAESENMDLIRKLYDFMTPYVSNSPRAAYLNYRDLDIGVSKNGSYEEGRVYGQKYFKGNFGRLVDVKTRSDPDNFFRNEQSIPTQSSSGEKLKFIFIAYHLIGVFVHMISSW